MSYKFWITSELKFLHQFIKTMPLPQIAKSLQRTEASVLRKAYELGIQPAQPVKRWSPAEIEIVLTLPQKEAAARTGRTPSSIRTKLRRLRA